MLSINKCIILLSLALSATAFGSSHVGRNNHRGVARNARPDVLADVIPVQKRTRSNTKRCKAKPASTSSSSSASHKHSSSKKIVKATAPAPKDTPAYTPKPEPKPKPKPTPDNGGGNVGGDLINGGIGTFYTQNGNAGACGDKHADSDIICALETTTYAGGAHCGKFVYITNKDTGKTVKVLVADMCPTCINKESIDLSTGAFHALGGTVGQGIFDIAWKFA